MRVADRALEPITLRALRGCLISGCFGHAARLRSAVLAAGLDRPEVPALRNWSSRSSRGDPRGREDGDADERVDELLGDLDRLVGPQAPAGSLFIRSEVEVMR